MAKSSLRDGQIVCGKYRLNRLLGSGGMADVWSATNTFTERQVAIKFMSPEIARTPEAATRFLKEAKVSARINHPNIIDILDVGQTEHGQLFLVMELLTGIPLDVALLRQTPPMTLYEFALVMVEVAEALCAAHKSGIVHRDLKPTNIFLHKVREGVAIPKLLDFGVSKFLEEDQNHALTMAGTVLGSPLYMSPEQARGESAVDGRTDVFAFGAMLFEALVGFRPYDAKNFNALIVKIATSRPKDIDACAPQVPDSLRAVVRACLEPDIDARAANFEEVLVRLRAALPDLEALVTCLPTPTIPIAITDPDATNALPVVRGSDRPPPVQGAVGSLSSSSSGAAVPPYPSNAPTGPSWHTPHTAYASIHAAPPRGGGARAWVLGAGAMTVIVALGVGIGFGLHKRSQRASASVQPPQVSEAVVLSSAQLPAPPPPSAPMSTNESSSVSIDSLPIAAKPAARMGRLSIVAPRRACKITVDGVAKGTTPLAPLDVPAGSHELRCESASGRVEAATLTVTEGSFTKHVFTPDE